MKLKNNILSNLTSVVLLTSMLFCSCEKYVAIATAPNQISVDGAFESDGTATGAVVTLYSDDYISRNIGYWSYLGGVESDELQYNFNEADVEEFEQANVSTTNSKIRDFLWNGSYGLIGQANLAIDKLNSSTKLTPQVKDQLLGEAKFFRALSYFYLINYFGDVPLVLNSDALQNANLPRTNSAKVWKQIISDLKDAENLMQPTYTATTTTNLRARANKYAAAALLARAYLYTKDYDNAEIESGKVISATDVTYNLPTLATAFINSSPEVILQIATTPYNNLPFLGTGYAYGEYSLAPSFAASFEAGDNRSSVWRSGTAITKYKLLGNEYNIILRLAEQYLIRAEARSIKGTNLIGAAADLNAVRLRAGLLASTASTQIALFDAIARERKVELFGEFSHRWFDLIRTGKASAVIGALKPGTWKSTAVLQPIPSIERIKNPALTQNPGYPN